jgi:hypothetical protein
MVRQVKDTLADINNKRGVYLKYLQHSNPKTPRNYGLPKIHNLHPINLNIDSEAEAFT